MRDYVRFVILTTGRSGSTWLVEALNSHDEIVCFGSLFEVLPQLKAALAAAKQG